MKRTRLVLVGIIAALCAFAFVGCSSSGQSSSSPSSSAAASSASPAVSSSASAAAQQEKGTTTSGTVTTTLDMTQYDQGKTVRVWIPVPQDGDYQTITDVAYDASTGQASMNTDAHGNKMLYVEWPADADPATRTVTLTFHVDREEAIVKNLVESGTPDASLDEYLQSSTMVQVDAEQVKSTADAIVEGKTTYLEKARAIYDWVVANMNRDDSVTGCGQGDICALLDTTMSGKCTDINSVFVGLCRAEGIPAREMFGVRLTEGDITTAQHCWAEFYLPGTGWVPADPADVLKAVKKNGWDKSSAEAKEKQEYYFGTWDSQRVELSSGRDLTLAPAQTGAALNDFGYPYGEVDGEALDFYDPANFVYAMTFTPDGK
jgi:transglutaminase-like putative cysteine protease